MEKAFTIGEAISHGWKKTVDNLGVFALTLVSFFIVSTILQSNNLWPIDIFVSYFALFTYLRFAFRAHRGEKISFKNIFEFDWKNFWHFFLASVISMILTWIGLLLLILPGVFVGVRLGYSAFTVIGENEGSIESLEESWRITRGHFWHIFGFFIVIVLINVVGAIALGIGLLITIPIGLIASVYVYEKLSSRIKPIVEISKVSPQPLNTL